MFSLPNFVIFFDKLYDTGHPFHLVLSVGIPVAAHVCKTTLSSSLRVSTGKHLIASPLIVMVTDACSRYLETGPHPVFVHLQGTKSIEVGVSELGCTCASIRLIKGTFLIASPAQCVIEILGRLGGSQD